jgi:hypothetical protein
MLIYHLPTTGNQPMASQLELNTQLLETKQPIRLLRLFGWSGFWIQLVLTVVSALILGFAILDANLNLNLKSGVGLLSVVGEISMLGFSIYWFFHYVQLARQLAAPKVSAHANRKEIDQVLQLGIFVNLAAMLLTLVGIEAIVGALLLKTLSVPQGAAVYRTGQLIEPIDIFVVQANISAIAAQFVGIGIPVWLTSRIDQH